MDVPLDPHAASGRNLRAASDRTNPPHCHEAQRHLTVSQVAALTHLTVRALHHYDAIGLLKPSQRSAAGYRLYDEEDLRRLRQILLFRELGFGLDTVGELIDATSDRQRQALLEQRAAVDQQRRHAEAVLRAVDATLDSLQEQRTHDHRQTF
jgi:DNA-binding transcriptional MerR regulator